jgi:hypothetical protein
MSTKEEKQNQDLESEDSKLNIEELMDVQGGIEDNDESDGKGSCGLGCYIGTGAGGTEDLT